MRGCRFRFAPLLAAAGLLLCCRATSDRWDVSPGGQLKERSAARWVVIAWTADWQCRPCRGELEKQLRYLATKYPDELELVWMTSASSPVRPALGTPGRVEEVVERRLQSEREGSPLPRIEVWTRGRVLLLRSLPPSLPEMRGLGQEIEWTRVFVQEG